MSRPETKKKRTERIARLIETKFFGKHFKAREILVAAGYNENNDYPRELIKGLFYRWHSQGYLIRLYKAPGADVIYTTSNKWTRTPKVTDENNPPPYSAFEVIEKIPLGVTFTCAEILADTHLDAKIISNKRSVTSQLSRLKTTGYIQRVNEERETPAIYRRMNNPPPYDFKPVHKDTPADKDTPAAKDSPPPAFSPMEIGLGIQAVLIGNMNRITTLEKDGEEMDEMFGEQDKEIKNLLGMLSSKTELQKEQNEILSKAQKLIRRHEENIKTLNNQLVSEKIKAKKEIAAAKFHTHLDSKGEKIMKQVGKGVEKFIVDQRGINGGRAEVSIKPN